MTGLVDWLAAAPLAARTPWPRHRLDGAGWAALVEALRHQDWELTGLWADGQTLHAALRDPADGRFALASHACADGGFASLGHVRPSAIRLERTIADLHGLISTDGPDRRPWLDHGAWPHSRLIATQRYPILPVEGRDLHQIPVGPVHAGTIEPGHFRFHAQGETVVRLEARLGYTHKGTEALMAGQAPEAAARLAARISGDSTVAHGWAFAQAVEQATGTAVPPRAVVLRAVLLELERVANHFNDAGAIANDCAFPLLHMEGGRCREQVLRLCEALVGHRLMMDTVVPGGLAIDLDPAGVQAIAALRPALEAALLNFRRVYETKPSLLDRTIGTGIIGAGLARRFAAGGYVGRASDRGFDARHCGLPPYDVLPPPLAVRTEGDVHARVLVRLAEIGHSLALVGALLAELPDGPVRVPLAAAGTGEGVGLVEGFRGDVLAWVRLAPDGTVARAHHRDPSWFHWPLIEAAIEGNIVADFPLINKSINGSYSGVDL